MTAALQEQHSCSKIAGRNSAPESCAAVHDSRSTESQPTGRGDAAMAAKKRGGSKRSAGKKSARRGGAKRGAKRASTRKAAKKAVKKAAVRKAVRKAAVKKAVRKAAVKKAVKKAVRKAAVKKAVRKAAVKRSVKRSSGARKTLARVKRVATGVVEQAQSAMTHGVEAVKELGENIVDRVSG